MVSERGARKRSPAFSMPPPIITSAEREACSFDQVNGDIVACPGGFDHRIRGDPVKFALDHIDYFCPDALFRYFSGLGGNTQVNRPRLQIREVFFSLIGLVNIIAFNKNPSLFSIYLNLN